MGKRQNILLERVSIMANKKMKTAVKSVKKQRTKKALKRTKVQSMENKKGVLFSIRAKIFLCFLVPILFLILVGVFSYKKAAAGMYDTFRDSNEQTINMANQYLDVSNSFIEAEALKYVGKKMTIMMPIMIENVQNDYTFVFNIDELIKNSK